MDCRRSMIFYRGKINQEWESELQSIVERAGEIGSQNNISLEGNSKVLLSLAFWKPFRCVGILFMLYNMSGVLVINTYTATFLEVNED